MEIKAALSAFDALSQETRLAIFRFLIQSGPRGMLSGELSELLGVKPNTMSANLSILLNAGLVRNEREGRSIRYFADLDGIRDLLGYLMQDCCAGHPELCRSITSAIVFNPEDKSMSDQVYNVLFLCTGNSARSVIAEAIINRVGQGRFKGYSAGSHPKGEVHPYTLDLLRNLNYPLDFARSKSWEEFADPKAPKLDFVFTVCDQAAAEQCPVWPGQPMSAHWGVPDPAAVTGKDAEIRAAFADTHRMLNNRISIFCSLPLKSLDRLALQTRLDAIGDSKG